MAIPIKKDSSKGFYGRERALVFCLSRKLGQQIGQQLEKKHMQVVLVHDEKQLLTALAENDPDLIVIEISAPTVKSIDRIVADIFGWMRSRARHINRVLNSPSGYLWEKSRVVLVKNENEITATSSLSGEIADTDDVVRLCGLSGDVKYIGIYSPLSFIGKMRALLE